MLSAHPPPRSGELVDEPERALGRGEPRRPAARSRRRRGSRHRRRPWARVRYPGEGQMRADFVQEVEAALGVSAVITEPEQLRTSECDGLTGHRVVPALVVLPSTTEEVQAVVRLCARDGVPFVARGAGTGLSGGALPVAEGIVISLSRMNRSSRSISTRPRRSAAGGHESRGHRSGRGRGVLLRARPLEPAGVHDRRQRGRELGWRPLPQARLHGHPCARSRGRAPRR